MNCDERIEMLVNRFGQTIADLPWTHGKESRAAAKRETQRRLVKTFLLPGDYQEQILHLTDVVDRMELALHAALSRMPRERGEIVREVFNDFAEDSGAGNHEEHVPDPGGDVGMNERND